MPDASRPLSDSLIGTWELVSREDHTASGERRVDPGLGADPIALLVYDGSGHFAAQFMKRDRSAVAETEATPAAQNNSRAQGGYDAYFGTYTIDDASSTVTQTLSGALSPENVGEVLRRGMTVHGDELTIQIQMTTGAGEPITRTLVWTRVGARDLDALPRVFRIAVPVSDTARARAFYEQLLGLEVDDTVPSRLYFHCGPVIVALIDWSIEGRGELHPLPDNLYLATADLDSVYQRSLAAGATITSPIETRPWGERSFYCLDLDGNRLCFVDDATLFLGRGAAWT